MKKLFLAALLSISSLPAFAQTATPPAGGPPTPSDACRQKVEQMCPGVKPGEGRIRDCLKQHNTTIEALCPGQGGGMHRPHAGNGGPGGAQGTPPQGAPPSQAPVATPDTSP